MYLLLQLKKVHIGGSWKIDCTGLIFFLCLSLLTSSASFPCLVSIVIIVYLSISDYLLVGIEFIWGILCLGKVEEANEGLYFSQCPCLPSSYNFVCALYLCPLASWDEPYWYITIHPSEQGARIFFATLDWDCSDCQVQLQCYRNKLEAVQVSNIHSARCSLCSQVAILRNFRRCSHRQWRTIYSSRQWMNEPKCEYFQQKFDY